MSQSLRPEPELVCRQCGQPGAFAFDEPLCVDCYQARGSCGAVREIECGEDQPAAANTTGGRASGGEKSRARAHADPISFQLARELDLPACGLLAYLERCASLP